jgi:alkaline phosphatase D
MTTRRDFLCGTLVSALASSTSVGRSQTPRFTRNPFSLGVASGYPTSESVVLWTRVAPLPLEPGGGMRADVEVHWEVAADERMRKVVRRGTERATSEWAHSVHVEPKGLEPARDYWYRFTVGDERSIVARTRTAPVLGASTSKLRLAVASCQQFEHGYFTAYQHMARDDLDLIVHNGDYIYEVSWGETRVRQHTLRETVTLDDYRIQYALYKSDPDLAAAHAACPWLVTWDDHEVFNDYAGDVVDLPVSREQFRTRRLAAYRAYYEHMPLPKEAMPAGSDMRIYTQRAFGDLASLYMLDQRQYRSPRACRETGQRRLQDCTELADRSRTMLGAAQESWLFQELSRSRARWNLMAQGTVMSHIDEDPGPGRRYWADAWNGYPSARDRIMAHLSTAKVMNPVVLTGDIHAFIVGGLHKNAADLDSPVVASELVTTSVTSQGTPQNLLDSWRSSNPNLLIADGQHRGYLRIDLSRDRLTADLVALETVRERNAGARTLRTFVIEAGQPAPVSG